MYNNKNQKAMTRMIAMFMAVLMTCLVGGPLAVAAGHGHQVAGAGLEEDLHLRAQGGSVLHGLGQLRGVGAEARGAEDKLPAQVLQIVRAKHQRGSQALQLLGQVGNLLTVCLVTHGDLHARAQQHFDQGHIADAHTDHRYRPAAEFL